MHRNSNESMTYYLVIALYYSFLFPVHNFLKLHTRKETGYMCLTCAVELTTVLLLDIELDMTRDNTMRSTRVQFK